MTNPSTSPDPLAPSSASSGAAGAGTPAESYAVENYAVEDSPSDSGFGSGGSGQSRSTTDVAKDQAANVKDTALDAGKNVAGTAKEQAATVAAEAKDQAKSLLQTVTSEVRDQGNTQQQRIAGAVHAVAKELGSMASSSQESGPVTDLAQQASRKVGEIGHWLENREPRELLDEVRRYARRRPAMFLAFCGLAGVVAGRLTRGAVAANTSLDSPDESSGSQFGSYNPSRSLESSYTPPPVVSGSPAVSTYDTSSTYDTPSTYGSQPPRSLVEEDTADYSTGGYGTGTGEELRPGTIVGDETRTDLNR